jgi:orotate phosphoribosyltransferase
MSSSAPRPLVCRLPLQSRWQQECRPRSCASRGIGHEIDEPPVRGADVAGRRVLLVDDAVSSGSSVERFAAALAGAGAEVVRVFVLVDMRDVADSVSSVAALLPTEAVSTYLQVLDLATANGLIDPAVHDLTVDALLNHWTDDDPRWDLLPVAA